jgi:hypothetical protein
MKRLFFLGIVVVSCLDGFCMERTVCFDVQNAFHKKVVAVSDAKTHLIKGQTLVNTLKINGGFRAQVDEHETGKITIRTDELVNPQDLFKISLKEEGDNPLIVRVVDVIDEIKASLYYPRMGGGNFFVLAIGDSEEQVSVDSVKKQQKGGQTQTYMQVK